MSVLKESERKMNKPFNSSLDNENKNCPCTPWCPGRKGGCHSYCMRYLAYEKKHMAKTDEEAKKREVQRAIDAPLIKKKGKVRK